MSTKTFQFIVKVYHKLLSHSFPRFFLVGGVGFIVNFIVLAVLYDWLGLPILVSQIVGSESALLTTFTGNNLWAFRDHSHTPLLTKLFRYHFSAGAGIAITTLVVVSLVKFGHVHYGIALVAGSASGMFWNYTMNSKIIFKKNKIA